MLDQRALVVAVVKRFALLVAVASCDPAWRFARQGEASVECTEATLLKRYPGYQKDIRTSSRGGGAHVAFSKVCSQSGCVWVHSTPDGKTTVYSGQVASGAPPKKDRDRHAAAVNEVAEAIHHSCGGPFVVVP